MNADHPPCPHATTTTLLWLYGEAPEDHLHHVAACPACAAVVAEHEAVLAAAVPAAREAVPANQPAPTGRRWGAAAWGGAAALGALAVAAVALVVMAPRTVSDRGEDTAAHVDVARTAPSWAAPADDALESLHDDLDALEASLATL
jgi:hypothetical protein